MLHLKIYLNHFWTFAIFGENDDILAHKSALPLLEHVSTDKPMSNIFLCTATQNCLL
jgi:hypothetical protein